jgi:epoxyqueuosine reductase
VTLSNKYLLLNLCNTNDSNFNRKGAETLRKHFAPSRLSGYNYLNSLKNKIFINSIKNFSRELGFSECGIVPATFLAEEEVHFRDWLDHGYHGQMRYLQNDIEKRLDPAKLLENAKTIIIVLHNYFTHTRQTDPAAPVISRYAFGKDYHEVVKLKLNHLLNSIRELLPDCNGRVFVDSAPIPDKAWARKAGLGWIGKNTLLISPTHGSFYFIGGILLDTLLPEYPIRLLPDQCGDCSLCMDACPTQAIISPRVLDAKRCVSYQTVEYNDSPDVNMSGKFRNRVFGCDICQEVCPWNRKAKEQTEFQFNPSPVLMNLTAIQWDEMDITLFNALFKGSPVKRTGYEKLKKNILFLKNS